MEKTEHQSSPSGGFILTPSRPLSDAKGSNLKPSLTPAINPPISRKEKATLDRFYKNIPIALVIYNFKTEEVLYVNASFLNLYGYTNAEYSSLRISNLFEFPEDQIIKKLQKAGRSIDTTHVTKNGRTLFVNLQGGSIKTESNKFACIYIKENAVKPKEGKDKKFSEAPLELSEVFEKVTEIIFKLDEKGNLLFVSPAFQRSLGYTENEVIGKPYNSFIHPTDLPFVIDLIDSKNKTNNPLTDIVFRGLHKDGSYVWLSTSVSFIFNEEGAIKYSIGLSQNITRLHTIVEKLKATEQRYASFLEQSSEAIWRIEIPGGISADAEFEVILGYCVEHGYLAECNQAYAKMYGYSSPEEMEGLLLSQLMPVDDPGNLSYFISFVEAGFKLTDGESVEHDRDGSKKYIINNLIGIIENGRLIRIWGTQRDITQHRLSQELLRESEERYRVFIQQSTEAIWRGELTEPINISDPVEIQINQFYKNAYLAECNDQMARLYGFENAKDLYGTRFGNFVDISDEFSKQIAREFISNGYRLFRAPSSQVDRNGNIKYYLNNLVGIIENEKVVRVWGSQTDITEQRKAEKALKASEERYRVFIQQSAEGIWRMEGPPLEIDLQTDEEIIDYLCQHLVLTECNDAFAKINGYQKSEKIIGSPLLRLLPGEANQTTKYLKSFIQGGYRLENLLVDLPTENGGIINTNVSIIGIVEKGKLARIWGTQRDITELKTAEKEIIKKEEQYRTLAENVPVMIYRMGKDFRFTYINKAVKESFVSPHDTFIGKTPQDLGLDNDKWRTLREKGDRVFSTGIADSFTFKVPSLTNSAKEYNLLINLTPERDETGQVCSIIAIANDITPIIKVQEELIYKDKLLSVTAESAYRLLKEENYNTIIPVIIKDIGTVTLADRVYVFENYKDEKGRLNTKQLFEWYAEGNDPSKNFPEDKSIPFRILLEDNNHLKEGASLFTPTNATTSEIEKLLVQMGVSSILIVPIIVETKFWGYVGLDDFHNKRQRTEVDKGILVAFASSLGSAIGRKKAQDAIFESEARFRQMADTAPVMIWVSDEVDNTIYVNKSWLEFTGVSIEEINNNNWSSLVYPEDINVAIYEYQEKWKQRLPVLLEYRLLSAAGEYRWVIDQAIPRFLADGRFLGYIGSLIDIHDRKLSEEKISFQALVMRELTEAIISTDLDSNVITWNNGAEKIYGIESAQIIGKPFSEFVIHNYINETHQEAFNHLFANEYWVGEVYYNRKDGRRIYLNKTISFITNIKKERIGIVYVYRDITDKRKSEEALRISEERHRSVVHALSEGILLMDRMGRAVTANRSAENILGLSTKEIIGKANYNCHWNTIHEDGSPFPHEKHPSMVTLQTGQSLQNIVMGIDKPDGSLTWITINTEPLYYSDQRFSPDAVVASFTDITQRKMAQLELQRNEQQLHEYGDRINNILDSITDGFIAVDNQLNIFLWNRVFETYSGKRSIDVIGRRINQVLPDLDESLYDQFLFALKENKTMVHEYHKKIQNEWFETTIFPSAQGLFIYFRNITKRKSQEALLALEKEVLELNARTQATLKSTTDFLLRGIENMFPGILCSVIGLREDEKTLETISAPSLPANYCRKVDQLGVGPNTGSCGTAMYLKKNVIVENIATSSVWENYKEVALEYQLAACWSFPISSSQNKVLGSFAIYHKQISSPSPEELVIIERTINILRVIIENKQSEEKIKTSNERYLLATMATNDAIWDWDVITNYMYWGEGFHALFGYKAGYFNKNLGIWEASIHPIDKDRVTQSIRNFVESNSQQVWHEEYRFRKSDGKYVLVADRGFLIYNQQGKVNRMVGSMQDVTDKREMENKLLNQELNKQKQVAQAVVDAQEKERSFIGKELHDNINQILSTAKLYLEVAKTDEKERSSLIDMSANSISDAINEIRTLSRSLVPSSIGDLGLVETIQDLVESIKLTRKLNVEFYHYPDIDSVISEQQKLMLYRIAQEQVNNVIKHANAKNLTIELMRDENNINISITDDGKGFDEELIKHKKGVGFSNISSRAELFNGKVKINSAPGKGCTLNVYVPIINR
ncbi:MAG: PAS domain S-box protein [Chitinophagaceae bacterium]